MKYYICDNCGAICGEDDLREGRIKLGEFWKDVAVCPECRSDDIHEAEQCRICGTPIEPGEDYCPDCKWDLRKIWNRAVESVMAKNDKDSVENERLFIEYLQDGLGVI